jgi:hypothetical protein
MSPENVEIAETAYRKLNASGSLDASFEFLAPQVEFHLAGAFPDLDSVHYGYVSE